MHKIYLSLGSNIGDTKQNLGEALENLRDHVTITALSSYYETEPVGYSDQPWFLNLALEGETELAPYDLLAFTQSIEKGMGRVKLIRFGPRNIDIDILLYDDLQMNDEALTIPHPRMTERAFVVEPLYEIAPQLLVGSIPLKQIHDNLKGEQIRKLSDEVIGNE
ncbi:MAG: 2-amino-4-hydroxy-6-hydroxymethyldihydropteridine diphosphokinase [Anaerofustis sp.]